MSNIDWQAAEKVAQALGVHTREIVASRDPEAVLVWALWNERENVDPRAASYRELAMLVGYEAVAYDDEEEAIDDAA